MERLKKGKIAKLILLSLLMCICCLIGVLVIHTPTATASADTTPRYRVTFSYTNNQITSNLGDQGT